MLKRAAYESSDWWLHCGSCMQPRAVALVTGSVAPGCQSRLRGGDRGNPGRGNHSQLYSSIGHRTQLPSSQRATSAHTMVPLVVADAVLGGFTGPMVPCVYELVAKAPEDLTLECGRLLIMANVLCILIVACRRLRRKQPGAILGQYYWPVMNLDVRRQKHWRQMCAVVPHSCSNG